MARKASSGKRAKALPRLTTRGTPSAPYRHNGSASTFIATLRREGRRVPDDVAVAGFDDSLLALTTDPPLTTVHQSFEQLGQEMVQLLLRVIDGAAPQAVQLPTRLMIRESA